MAINILNSPKKVHSSLQSGRLVVKRGIEFNSPVPSRHNLPNGVFVLTPFVPYCRGLFYILFVHTCFEHGGSWRGNACSNYNRSAGGGDRRFGQATTWAIKNPAGCAGSWWWPHPAAEKRRFPTWWDISDGSTSQTA